MVNDPHTRILRWFPNLRLGEYRILSIKPRDPTYNCIAWAAGDPTRFWWPDAAPRVYWPEGVALEETLEAFIAAFRTLGYEPCDDEELEKDYEKIAIYVGADGAPTHAARQELSGRWTSKLGVWELIEHNTLDGLTGFNSGAYGVVAQIMRRPRKARQLPRRSRRK